jgi:hypothetical protein
VFGVSAGLIGAFGAVAIYNSVPDHRLQIFNTILPVLSAWGGTILAFYFSRANFEAANTNLRHTIDKLTVDQRLRETPVHRMMVPRTILRTYVLENASSEDSITIKKLWDFMNSNRVTCVPIVNTNNVVLYVVDYRTLFHCIVQRALSEEEKSPIVRDMRFEQFKNQQVENSSVLSRITNFVVVSVEANLAEARDKLHEQRAHVVVVTKGGRKSEPVEGWLTETDIARSSELR